MWRSKQAPTASPAFSPAFVPTATIEPEENVATNLRTSIDSDVIPAGIADIVANAGMSSHEDVSLDGTMEGPLSLKCHRLTVGRSAKATAEVVADEVIVYGELTGKLCAGSRIEIKKDGSVIGTLTTPRIIIEDGAYFKGSVQIERRKKPRGTPQQHM